uniref:RNA helicase n=1 Tax=Acrobeloides nanus TaxID=290746 RepID=A0A914DAV8_9BILA
MLQKIRRVISKLRNIQPFQSSILKKLFRILTNHFKQHAKDGRVMIFVKERLYAIELTRLIKKYLININVDFLTGITEKVELGGTKPERQNQVIQEFSSGAIQVLVTTSVSEEGLDIAKCNLVIKYSYVTNEIAHVQRRGRGRDLSSKCVLLTNDEKEKKKEDLNMIAESMMFEAMNIMVQIPSDDFVRRVDETIQELYKKREESRALAQEKSTTLKANARSYRILCRKCTGYVTNATQLRTYQKSQFVVSDKTFWERVSCKEIPLEERIPRAPDVGLYFCMNIKKVDGTICGYNLGRVTIIRNIYLPYVNCKSITFEKTLLPADQLDRVGSTPEIFSAKKWKEVITKYFEPKEIEGIDLKEMQMASKRPEFVIHNPQNAGEFLADSAGVPMEEEDSNVPSSVNS